MLSISFDICNASPKEMSRTLATSLTALLTFKVLKVPM